MSTSVPTRRLVGGASRVLLALLLVLAPLLASCGASAQSWSGSTEFDGLVLASICHSADGQDQKAPSRQGDCMVCPACHLTAAVSLPAPPAPILPAPLMVSIGRSTPLPPAIGPPSRKRTAAQPTGPPVLSV